MHPEPMVRWARRVAGSGTWWSGCRFGATLEARFIDHELHGTTGVDLLVFAITRERWLSFAARLGDSGLSRLGDIDAFRAELCHRLGFDVGDPRLDSATFFPDLDSLEKVLVLDLVESGGDRDLPGEMIAAWESLGDVYHSYAALRGQ